LIRRWTQAVFPRDAATSKDLKAAGIRSEFLGNPMFDGLQPTGENHGFKAQDCVIGLVPGSRQEAYQNLVRQLEVCLALSKNNPSLKFMASIAPSLKQEQLMRSLEPTAWRCQNGLLKHSQTGLQIPLCYHFADVLQHSRLILGMAGTANEQAVQLGRSVLAFPGTGPQSSRKRFLEQKKLLEGQLHFVDSQNPNEIAYAILNVLKSLPSPTPPLKVLPSASQAIAAAILSDLH